jgi:CRP-like cAMP-binding protein
MSDEIESLLTVPLFCGFERKILEDLRVQGRRQTFSAGQEIINEGEQDRTLFVILSGSVEVFKSRGTQRERLLSTMGPPEYFGEMALIDDMVRSATVVAKEDTVVLALDQQDLLRAIEKCPRMALDLLRTLSRRIRALEKILSRTLGGLVPICVNCKNIRDESGHWVRLEEYIGDRSDADFTHGICPQCMKKLYPKHFSGSVGE